MIQINARAIIERLVDGKPEVIVQWRNKQGEGCYEFPGGRINEFESFYDALRREVKEETGLDVTQITGRKDYMVNKEGWEIECFKPFTVYQTLKGDVDSMGAHFKCRVTGEPLSEGDDTKYIKWIGLDELRNLVDIDGYFNPVDKAAALLYLKENG